MRHAQGWSDYLLLELERSKHTQTTYFESVKRLERTLGKEIEQAGPDDLRRFLREADNYSTRSKAMSISAAKSYHRYCVLEGHCEMNGVLAVQAPMIRTRRKPPLTRAQAQAVLLAPSTSTEWRLVYLGLYAGLRVGESTSITANEWAEDRLCITGKGGKYREVPVHLALAAQRERILEFQPSNPSTLKSAAKRLCKRVGFHFSTHTLRRTFSDTLYDREAPYEIVQQLIGHNIPGVTHLYALASFRRLVPWVHGVDYWGEP